MEALVFIGLVVVGTAAVTRAILRRRARRQQVGPYEAAYLESPQRQRLAQVPHGFQPSAYTPPPVPTQAGGIGVHGRHAAATPVWIQVHAMERKIALYHEYVFIRGDACDEEFGGKESLRQRLSEIDNA